MREFTNMLLTLVREGVLDSMDVLENVIGNYLSEEQVKDFCLREYERYFNDGEEENN